MKRINRRTFFSNSMMTVAAWSVPATLLESNALFPESDPADQAVPALEHPKIIDTNVHLLEYPFRKLKYGETPALVKKLQKHRISQAWAGSYEALFHKNIDAVNSRLAEECKKNGKGMLLPFGTVNIAWPDWEEDLRRCHEVYKMPGIRIYPIYQTFDFKHPDFIKLVQEVAKRKMILQVVGDIDDTRNIHPTVQLRVLSFEPLVDVMKKVPDAKVQLIYWNNRVSNKVLERFIQETNVVLDIARIEGNGGVSRLIDGQPWGGTAAPVPADRLLFGSHAPYFPVEANLLKLFESPLSTDQLQAIMNKNAIRFLKNS
jgi:predicted TIM-barrel fold metal-dependent hydrolase